jgi:hypothetical protein
VARIVDSEAALAIEIPEWSPSGAAVAVEWNERDRRRRLHAQTPDASEVYVEVLVAPELVDHAASIADQMAFLRDRAIDPTLTEAVPGTCAGRPATTFDFAGELGGHSRIRRFAFVDAGGRTYRIVHDPTSPANAAILRTLVLATDT